MPAVILGLVLLPGAGSMARANGISLDAPGGPGVASHFDLARKDCVGTAYGRRSRVWFTVADGALSDVYYPTIDNTNVGSLQLVVTDGRTFTDLQSRNMTYTVRRLAGAAPGCTVTATATSGRYKLTESFVSDPLNNTVMIHIALTRVIHSGRPLRIYVWFDPTINGNGGGAPENEGGDTAFTASAGHRLLGVTYDRNTTSLAVNRGYAAPVYAALTASTG
jgi:glucoamylase